MHNNLSLLLTTDQITFRAQTEQAGVKSEFKLYTKGIDKGRRDGF